MTAAAPERRTSSFPRIRARSLLPLCMLGGIIVAAIGRITPGLGHASRNQWGMFALFYLGIGIVLWARAEAAHLDAGRLIGPVPPASTLRLTVVAVPLMMLAIAGFWILFLPLSYALPNFVRAWALAGANAQPVTTMRTWSAQFIVAAVIAPVIEELLFRGFLMQRWAAKWGTRRAVIASSALFAIGHVELLGHFAFGVVMCALYLRTRSLWVPMATHALNNALAALGGLSAVLSPAHADRQMTLESLRAGWWVGIVLLASGVALLEWYRRRYWGDVNLRALIDGPTPMAD